jgi:hypothetical protein
MRWHSRCSGTVPEGLLSTRTIGIIASVIGSAFGAWWMMNYRRSRTAASATSAPERGTVIFDNTPAASDVEGII